MGPLQLAINNLEKIGNKQNMGGRTVNRKSVTDKYVILYTFGLLKAGWANANPAHLALMKYYSYINY